MDEGRAATARGRVPNPNYLGQPSIIPPSSPRYFHAPSPGQTLLSPKRLLAKRGSRTVTWWRKEGTKGGHDVGAGADRAQLALATMYEQPGDYASAKKRHRVILKGGPNNVSCPQQPGLRPRAREQPAEAQVLEKAGRVARARQDMDPRCARWIAHLLGNTDGAAQVLSRAVKLGPAGSEVRLQAAIVFGATGAISNEAELKEALV